MTIKCVHGIEQLAHMQAGIISSTKILHIKDNCFEGTEDYALTPLKAKNMIISRNKFKKL